MRKTCCLKDWLKDYDQGCNLHGKTILCNRKPHQELRDSDPPDFNK